MNNLSCLLAERREPVKVKRSARRTRLMVLLSLTALCLFYPIQILLARDSAVVLQYHHVGTDTPKSTSLTPEQFKDHLAYLERKEFTVWSLEKIVSTLRNGHSLPERCVAITFDDAYTSVFTVAYPLLKERNWPFTVFVATEAVEKGFSSVMTWEQMRLMKSPQVTFASHSHTHPQMVYHPDKGPIEKWRETMSREISVSRNLLIKRLDADSFLFAYPYGEYDLESIKLVEEQDMVGVGQHSGGIWSGSDFMELPRFPMSGAYAKMDSFNVKVNSKPLPVISVKPKSAVVKGQNNPPTLELKLADGSYHLDSLACYASGQGRIEITWKSKSRAHFTTAARNQLPVGRSRYNCTARHKKENRYYWFSRQWLRLK